MIKDHKAVLMTGETIPLTQYHKAVLLIVNTASKCGYTPQFQGLQALYERHHDAGFEVLGFPCNQFKDQDPENNETILSYCQTHFGVTFPMFQKVNVNGEDAHPLFAALKAATGHDDIRWNFEKFLISREGEVLKRYTTKVTPEAIEADLIEVLYDHR